MPATPPLRLHESSFQAILKARAYAQELGHAHIGTEHLLLGTLSTTEGDKALHSICEKLNLTVERVALKVLWLGNVPIVDGGSSSTTSQFQRALEKAQGEAQDFGDSEVFPRHILLALMPASEEEYEANLSGAGLILNTLGFTPGKTKTVFSGELKDYDTPVDQLVPVFMD